MTGAVDGASAPLYRGTRATIRPKGLLGNPFVELTAGPRSAASIPSGGTLPLQDTASPVDLDQVMDLFDPQTRSRIQTLTREGGASLANRGSDLNVFLAAINSGEGAGGRRGERGPLAAGGPLATGEAPARLVHPREASDIRRVRDYRIQLDGRTYRILRGDLHRHTDTSPDGVGDGSMLDLYRYAMDAAANTLRFYNVTSAVVHGGQSTIYALGAPFR